MIGTRLAHFEIVAVLGRGGMGEVYRARDVRLDRDVAIKVLPELLAHDPARLERFEREARLLASLSHPSIAALYDVGRAEPSAPPDGVAPDGVTPAPPVRYLVMELVEGETLAERVRRGPLPVDEALRIASEIASALEAAHGHGIVHRDLKPANVKLDADDRVRLLDFGLGKVLAAPTVEVGRRDPDEPTAVYLPTASGIILGTPRYMSPEQAKGRPVDGRADLWSLGVVLWEMLTGRPLFGGESAADALAAVLGADIDFDAVPAATPAVARRLLGWLLSRDPERRLRHPGDAWLILEAARHGPAVDEASAPQRPSAAELGAFRLTIEVCRGLERENLVPEMIGDDVVLIDNRRSSDVLVFYLPSIGDDHEQFREVVERSSYRGISVSPYGWQEGAKSRPPLPLRDHLTILGQVLADALRRIGPRRTIVAGFSSGADLALRLATETAIEPPVDGVLALGPNVSLATCFFTGRLAEIPSDTPESMLAALREVGASAESLEEWTLLTPFLLQLARRFRGHVPTLRSLAREVVAPFEAEGPSPFATWYRTARQRGIVVRAIFCGASFDLEGVAALRMAHLESEVLGPNFVEEDLVVLRDRVHIQLVDPDLVEEHTTALVSVVG